MLVLVVGGVFVFIVCFGICFVLIGLFFVFVVGLLWFVVVLFDVVFLI